MKDGGQVICAMMAVIFSRSFACHAGHDARVSVQATRKRKGRSHSSSTHNDQHVIDPSPSAAGEFAPRQQHPIFAGKGGNIIRQACSPSIPGPQLKRADVGTHRLKHLIQLILPNMTAPD